MRIVVTRRQRQGRPMGRRATCGTRGHDVLNVDLVHDGSAHGLCVVADLTDLGQVHEVIAGADAVVHLAAIPAPELRPRRRDVPDQRACRPTTSSGRGRTRGVGRVVWASSETVLGLPFDTPPDFAPIDESHPPRPETSYALSKLVGETMAAQFARRTGDPVRRAPDLEHHGAVGLRPVRRRGRTTRGCGSGTCGATSTRAMSPRPSDAVSRPTSSGAEVCIVAAADTCMTRDSADLMAEVSRRSRCGGRSPAARRSCRSTARAQLLGYEPEHSWLDEAR